MPSNVDNHTKGERCQAGKIRVLHIVHGVFNILNLLSFESCIYASIFWKSVMSKNVNSMTYPWTPLRDFSLARPDWFISRLKGVIQPVLGLGPPWLLCIWVGVSVSYLSWSVFLLTHRKLRGMSYPEGKCSRVGEMSYIQILHFRLP